MRRREHNGPISVRAIAGTHVVLPGIDMEEAASHEVLRIATQAMEPLGAASQPPCMFSSAADTENGENLLLIRDRRIAVSYVIEALRIFDHYHFRVTQQEAENARKKLVLARPPRNPEEKPWWDEDYTDARKIRDRELFAW